MIMNEDAYLGSMTYQSLYAGVLDKLEPRSEAAVQQLRIALRHADDRSPSFLLDLTKHILAKSQLNVNLQESFLRLQATAPTDDLQLSNPHPAYQELSLRAVALRKVLSRVPDEMGDRRTFLETIKEIASSIKKLLDATNTILQTVPSNAQPAVEKRKREFVHYSKRFSNTLKEYFKDQNANHVAVSANQLIFQTSFIVKTVREKTRNL
uniref:Programmed cell death protein 10 n=2 Tax=Plectus sambesii TaxID=2011161 RepID=A0A914WBM9_9BILA